MQRHVEALAAALPAIHAVRLQRRHTIPPYARYHTLPSDRPPAWTQDPNAWRAIIARAKRPPPPSAAMFIHRDYHPANVLFARGRVSGVIDWVNASTGPAEVDVGHCRWNLAVLHGLPAADAFLDAWLHFEARETHNPYYDITTLLDSNFHDRDLTMWHNAGRTDLTPAIARRRLDAYAASLANRLA